MKTLTTKLFCVQLQLYRVGVMIGAFYIALNVSIIWTILSSEDNDFAEVLLSSLTIMTSIILIYALNKNCHALLLPWLSNVAVLILFNIFAVVAQFVQAAHLETRAAFYWACLTFLSLETQVLFWYTIFALFRVGHRKTFRVAEFMPEIPPGKYIENNETFKIYLVGTDVSANEKEVGELRLDMPPEKKEFIK